MTAETNEKKLEIFTIAILLGFGIYHSILYFGHQLVPNPDFTGFVDTGREILSFHLPSNYKRAPVLGVLQVLLSQFISNTHPELTAGWLLNAILHPLNLVLLWLIGRHIVGKSAVWIALIAIINPWVITMLVHPLAETTLLFFVLLSFYLIFKRSGWAYLAAAITSMVRYEGAALILCAFVMDMIYSENRRQRIVALLYSVLASVPLLLWMLGTILNFQNEGGSHYLKELGTWGTPLKTLLRYLEMMWYSTFLPLFIPPPATPRNTYETIITISKITAIFSFIFAAVYGICKRKWKILIMLIFLAFYLAAHVMHSGVLPRFCIIVHWIPLLLCFFGLQSLWKLIAKKMPVLLLRIIQIVVSFIAILWLISLIDYLPKVSAISPTSASMPYIAMLAAVLLFLVRAKFGKEKFQWHKLSVIVLVFLMITSNQFILAKTVSDGKKDAEFKELADWYIANALPGEKMIASMANIVRIFTPMKKDSIIHLAMIKSESPSDFVKKCHQKDIKYVIWDSRTGSYRKGRYYKLWNFNNIEMLSVPKSIGPYKFIKEIRANERRYLHIFQLKNDSNINNTM